VELVLCDAVHDRAYAVKRRPDGLRVLDIDPASPSSVAKLETHRVSASRVATRDHHPPWKARRGNAPTDDTVTAHDQNVGSTTHARCDPRRVPGDAASVE
jgi:hypothetical protein